MAVVRLLGGEESASPAARSFGPGVLGVKAFTDITLPSVVKPRFPRKCVVCCSIPDSSTKITQNSTNAWLGYIFPFLFLFGWSRVEIPICRSCKPRFYAQRWSRVILCWLLVAVAYFYGMPLLSDWSRLGQKAAILGVVAVAMLPYILFEIFWPRYFDTTASGDDVTYMFASDIYACEFAVLNFERTRTSTE